MKLSLIKKLLLTLPIMTILILCKRTESIQVNITPEPTNNFKIFIDTTVCKPISPYIYGINGVPSANVTVTAHRLGGNRTTGYNWENNLSNAGEDWHNYNDEYLIPKGKDGSVPAITVTDFVENAKRNGKYALITLPMAGYVANDNKRSVTLEETAPSYRFAKIINRKNEPLSLMPDLTDSIVYQDEFISFLINKFGKAGKYGINGYSLDNEPALWPSTHPRIHPEKTTITEILEKSISLAKVVKDFDPAAEIFGPVLYGLAAYANFQDAPDWKDNYANNYKWFIDAYLDGMSKAEKEDGRRLLDVLDLHYYTEARCPLDHRVTDDINDNVECYYTRMQSTRSLWDASFRENSWVQQTLSRFLPVLPVVKQAIETYYPGTKLSISEYNFGYENHISGGIAQADALGIFAVQGVYFASLWPISDKHDYAYAGINLYTNYDGKGGTFGDTLVDSVSSKNENTSVYASIDKNNILHIVLLNKNIKDKEHFTVSIQSDITYKTFKTYGFTQESHIIRYIGSGIIGENKNNIFNCVLPPISAYHLVVK